MAVVLWLQRGAEPAQEVEKWIRRRLRCYLWKQWGRRGRYARYNAELTSKALNAWGMGDIDPSAVSQLDSVAHVADLSRIGQRVGDEIKIEHFGPFV